MKWKKHDSGQINVMFIDVLFFWDILFSCVQLKYFFNFDADLLLLPAARRKPSCDLLLLSKLCVEILTATLSAASRLAILLKTWAFLARY